MSFVPMYLRRMDRSVLQANRRLPFALSPQSLAISPTQPPQLPDRPAGGNSLDVPHRPEDLEVRRPKLSRAAEPAIQTSCSPDQRLRARTSRLLRPRAAVGARVHAFRN